MLVSAGRKRASALRPGDWIAPAPRLSMVREIRTIAPYAPDPTRLRVSFWDSAFVRLLRPWSTHRVSKEELD